MARGEKVNKKPHIGLKEQKIKNLKNHKALSQTTLGFTLR